MLTNLKDSTPHHDKHKPENDSPPHHEESKLHPKTPEKLNVIHEVKKPEKVESPVAAAVAEKDPIAKIHEMEKEIEEMKHEIDDEQARKASPDKVKLQFIEA